MVHVHLVDLELRERVRGTGSILLRFYWDCAREAALGKLCVMQRYFARLFFASCFLHAFCDVFVDNICGRS